MLCLVLCKLHIVQCTHSITQFVLYPVNYIHCTPCTLYILHCTLKTVHCTLTDLLSHGPDKQLEQHQSLVSYCTAQYFPTLHYTTQHCTSPHYRTVPIFTTIHCTVFYFSSEHYTTLHCPLLTTLQCSAQCWVCQCSAQYICTLHYSALHSVGFAIPNGLPPLSLPPPAGDITTLGTWQYSDIVVCNTVLQCNSIHHCIVVQQYVELYDSVTVQITAQKYSSMQHCMTV